MLPLSRNPTDKVGREQACTVAQKVPIGGVQPPRIYVFGAAHTHLSRRYVDQRQARSLRNYQSMELASTRYHPRRYYRFSIKRLIS